MNTFFKDPAKLLMQTLLIIIVVLAAYFLLPVVFTCVMPFIVAYAISKLIVPMADFLVKRLKFPHKLAIAIVMLLLIGLLGLLVFTIFYQGVYELQRFSYVIPSIIEGDFELPRWITKLTDFYYTLPLSMREFVVMISNNLRENIYSIIEPATQAVINAATRVAKALPNIFIFTVILILSTYFICTDRQKISGFFKGIIPQSVMRRIEFVKDDLVKACGGYLKAQLILMGLTFLILFFGFTILGVDTAAFVAFVVAIIDLIPVLGTGTVLIPWAVISLFSGKYFFALGLVIIYAIAFVIRRISEPKIVSTQIGLNPLLTLVAVYAGLKTMGIFGMILGPIIAIIIINFIHSEKHYKEQQAE